MAEDLLHLEAYPQPQTIRLRHYHWMRPAFTFGYSQQYAWVKQQLPPPIDAFEICRRPTGGGVVDHRHDFTYSLIIPPQHTLYREPPHKLYRIIHEAIVTCLLKNNQEAQLQPCINNERCATASSTENILPTVCFQRTEAYDVIHPSTHQKIAGAALKRNRHGLLFQGSIEKRIASSVCRWGKFFTDYIEILANQLDAEAVKIEDPEYDPEIKTFWEQKLHSQKWNQRR